jgi:DNA-binding MarR family transcriptional regulator
MKKSKTPSEIEHSILLASKIMVNILAESLIRAGDKDITVPQFRILDMVYNGTTTPAEIARMLDVSPPSISEMLEKLENKGLLTRLINTADRRKIELTLSEIGLTTVENVNDYRAAYLQRILNRMGRETAMQLKESLAGFNQSYAKLKSKAVDTLADRDIQRFDTKQRATKQ